MKIYVFLLTAYLSAGTMHAQHLGAYTNYLDHFFIFDRGESIKVEELEPQSFKVGGECVLYVNSQGNLKMYRNGEITKLEPGGISSYHATDHIAAYSVFEKLNVIRNGAIITLSTRCPVYRVEDSLVVYYDKNLESLRVYYHGESVDIESGLVGIPVQNFRSGDNTVAYISTRLNDFKVYYRGENHILIQNVERLDFQAGKDIVAYNNPVDNSFNVFYKGEIVKLEDFFPKSYRVGDGFVAYVDNMDVFKVFYDNRISEVSSFAPEAYYTEDNLILFTEYSHFKVFYKGMVYELEPYIPDNFRLDLNSVAYLDNTNRIWYFSAGNKQFFANELVNSFDIYRDLVVMNVKVDRNVIYYKGNFYEGENY